MGRVLAVDEAPRLLFEQDNVLGHPGRAGNIQGVHESFLLTGEHTARHGSARGRPDVDKGPLLSDKAPPGRKNALSCNSSIHDRTWCARSTSAGSCLIGTRCA